LKSKQNRGQETFASNLLIPIKIVIGLNEDTKQLDINLMPKVIKAVIPIKNTQM